MDKITVSDSEEKLMKVLEEMGNTFVTQNNMIINEEKQRYLP